MPRDRREGGFTLVELMVVIMIIAILIAIAVPTFMAFRRRADEASAKSSANLAVKVARSLSEEDSYAPVTLGALTSTEPSLRFLVGSAPSTGPLEVSQEIPDALQRTFVLAVYSRSRTCFFLRDDIMATTEYGSLVDVPSANCRADNAGAVAFGPGW